MMTREAQKRIERAKRQYGLAPGFGSAILSLASDIADSPWSLAVSLAALILCIYLIL
jgi:multidrug efflux pump subunit AcrB